MTMNGTRYNLRTMPSSEPKSGRTFVVNSSFAVFAYVYASTPLLLNATSSPSDSFFNSPTSSPISLLD